ncbi:hypothetical protein BB559_001624 [Furculomyces boomerangus]|uniref:Oxidoreductase-like domain-containing protein n=1 Tax=Furculomyces boomerangus TaxID=61424 RepID=A0A2T9Z1A3_9FUNG|nr:hypothetical protein BB559_007311 [Furculomyces boomerangus]PVU98370.1 hypothetical protein BB559_001624 [Furculomyces boomerangus]
MDSQNNTIKTRIQLYLETVSKAKEKAKNKSNKDPLGPPGKPDIDDCCNTGCYPCIFDIYREKLTAYNNTMQKCNDEADIEDLLLKKKSKKAIQTNVKNFEPLKVKSIRKLGYNGVVIELEGFSKDIEKNVELGIAKGMHVGLRQVSRSTTISYD